MVSAINDFYSWDIIGSAWKPPTALFVGALFCICLALVESFLPFEAPRCQILGC
jgi:hypothetical protein